MKKLFITLVFLLAFLVAKSQDTPPTDADFKSIPSYIIKYHLADSTIWMYKGTPLYGWTKLAGDLRHWWTLLETNTLGVDTTFTRISNRDSVSLVLYRLISDTTRLKGTATIFDLLSYKLKDDSLKYFRRLNNHDSLSTLDERQHASLTNVLGAGSYHLSQSQRDSILTAEQHADTVRLKGHATVYDLLLKVNVSDTAAMLSDYINKADTSAMLSKYATDVNLTYKKDLNDSTDADGYTRRDRFLTGLNTKYGGSGAAGQVAFHTAARTLSGDNGLFWDNVNKWFGLGTIDPWYQFDMQGSAALASITRFNATGVNYPPGFLFIRARGTQASPANIIAGDWLGKTQFQGLVTTNLNYGAFAFIASDISQNGRFSFLDRDLSTERVVILNTGNAGFKGVIAPTASVHIGAGTATAGTAPIKLTSGTLLGTAESGAIEFLTDAYYGTITTGAARRQFAFEDDSLKYKVNVSDTAAMLSDYINKADTSAMLEDYINKADTSAMLSKYATDVNLTYKEDKSNKVTSISGASTDIQYPSAKSVYGQLVLKAPALSGTTNYVSKFINSTTLGNSHILDNGTNVIVESNFQILPANSDVVWSSSALFIEQGTRIGLRAGTDYSFNIDTYNNNNPINILKISQSGSTLLAGPLTIQSASDASIKFDNTNYAGTDYYIYSDTAGSLNFYNGGANKLMILANGNSLFGYSTDQGYKAAFNGTVLAATSVTTPTILLTAGAQANYFWKSTGTTGAGAWSAITASQFYNGAWDANTNTPTLADGTGTQGTYYHCTVSGTVDFDGAGGRDAIAFTQYIDDVAYNGATWEKIPNAQYQLLTMSASVIGGAKLGGSLQVNADVLNINNFDATEITISGTGSDIGKIWTIDAQNSAFWTGKVTDESGSGLWVFNNSPTLITPALGTPSALVGTNITGTAAGLTAGTVTNGVYTTTFNELGDARYLPLTGGILTGGLQVLPANSDAVFYGSGIFMENGTRIGLRAGTDYSFNIDMYNENTPINVLKIAQNGAITTGSTLYTNGVISTVATGTSTDWNAKLAPGDTATMLAKYARKLNPTFTGLVTTPLLKVTTGAGAGKVLLSDADGDLSYSASALGTAAYTASTAYQATLVSGTNLKTVGGVTLLGSGDIGVLGSTYGGTGVNNAGRNLTINSYSGTINFSAASKTLTVPLDASVSGTNTGDQTNITGNAATVTTNANLSGHITSVGNTTSLGSFTSANLSTALTNETGTGAAVFATSPTFVTPTLGVALATSLDIRGTENGAAVLNLGTSSAINAVVNTDDEMYFNIDANNNQTGLAYHFRHNSTLAYAGAELVTFWDNGNATFTGTVTGTQFISNIAIGTAPLSVTSTTVVPNLNVSFLEGHAASYFQVAGSFVGVADTATMLSKYARKLNPVFTGLVTTPLLKVTTGAGLNKVLLSDADGDLSYSASALGTAAYTASTAYSAALSGTINEIAYFNSATTIASLAVATYPSLTELSYVKGVTSAIQTQLNAKQATLVSGTNLKTVGGVNLLGSGDIGIITSAYGGTGNGFTKFLGATTSEKTYTLPDANETFPAHGAANNVMLSNGTIWTSAALGSAAYTASGDYATSGHNHTGVYQPVGSYLTAAITSLGGLTAATQTFAIGTTGTAPNWSSATSTHTLHIPMASGATVTAGLISYSQFSTFTNKLATNGSAAQLTDFPTFNQNTSGTAANATLAATVTVVDDVSTDASYYPMWATGAGSIAPKISTTKMYFNPSTGVLTATNHKLSDERLKRNIKPIDFRGLKIDKVQWIQYIEKDDPKNIIHYGVSAQKLEKVFPDFVDTATDSLKTKSVNYTELIILRLAEMEAKQVEMEREILILKNKVSNLERKTRRNEN